MAICLHSKDNIYFPTVNVINIPKSDQGERRDKKLLHRKNIIAIKAQVFLVI